MSIHFRRLASRAFLPSFTSPPATPLSLRLYYLLFLLPPIAQSILVAFLVLLALSSRSRPVPRHLCVSFISRLCVFRLLFYTTTTTTPPKFLCVSNFFDCSIFVLFDFRFVSTFDLVLFLFFCLLVSFIHDHERYLRILLYSI
ncbi:hypothetical protein M413DRAFT_322285 [Hebeloma cylindrosporum]|uniref:Uncharacterized protein n=1 Tax=Hebeloma cylindrosporum TaxID=76867 RepID=A0A0C2XDZ3_HEBCY|nr:hypothetical protein M413DRAFT_322285 [Hebeloma cylindrosporum h7]